MRLGPLFTDLYQLTMAEAYLSSDRGHQQAAFELSFRRAPFGGEYAIFAGLDQVKDILESFHFTEENIRFLKELPTFREAPISFFENLRKLDLKDIEIDAFEEGALIFPKEPLLQVRGPIFKAQLLETTLLNAINFSTLVATYARRIRIVAPNKKLVEFGMRRAQGQDAAMIAARSSYLGGFDATSNVLAGQKWTIPVVGTMAHSFVQSFTAADLSSTARALIKIKLKTNEGELAAFFNYAERFPNDAVLLVDTYDTLSSGIPNAICVFQYLKSKGFRPRGVRLDSGDLGYLSREARKKLNEAGLQEVSIFASNELDEKIIKSLEDQQAQIDSYGVGTKLATAYEQAALGGVYKLVEVNGRPRTKISQQVEKRIIPGAKQVYRLQGEDSRLLLDLLTQLEDRPPKCDEDILALHPADPLQKALVRPKHVTPMLQPLYRKGKWLRSESLGNLRQASLSNMSGLREDILRIHNPTPYKVSVSSSLRALMDQVYNEESPITRLA